ncbi:MAG: hypothetical protein WCK28_06060 [Burkholderiales bacterium]|jgi:hypothetical protein
MEARPAPRNPDGPVGRISRNTHEGRLLLAFIEGRRFTRKSADDELGNTAVNSTVSFLQSKHGVRIDREWIEVPTRYGETTRVKQYWLAESSVDRAMAALGMGGDDAL